MPTNKNYQLHPSTDQLYSAYSLFISHNSISSTSIPFEELSQTERILIYYWYECHAKLADSILNSNIVLHSNICELYKRTIYKALDLDCNEIKKEESDTSIEHQVGDVG